MRLRISLGTVLLSAALIAALVGGMRRADSQGNGESASLARGKYLVAFACNDCHTPGWRESDGAVPVAQWMTGSNVGYRGPWGTSYPANVRLEFQTISERDWLFMVATRGGHWPMVWHDLRVLTSADQRSIYEFIHALGPKGVEDASGSSARDRTDNAVHVSVADDAESASHALTGLGGAAISCGASRTVPLDPGARADTPLDSNLPRQVLRVRRR